MKNIVRKYLLFLSSAALCVSSSYSSEERVILNTHRGDVREISIPVPSKYQNRTDQYVKAYALLYMKWWNEGARESKEHQFNIETFDRSTPPDKIHRDITNAVKAHFKEDDLWEEVASEGEKFAWELNKNKIQNSSLKKMPPPVLSGNSESVKIEMNGGSELEIAIPIPTEFASRAGQYKKSYILHYMEWWNSGVGFSARDALKYRFDPEIYSETTLPEKIDRDIENAVYYYFADKDFFAKVALEGSAFIKKINYRGNDNVTEREIAPWCSDGPRITLNVPIPSKYKTRSEEYAHAYMKAYMDYWNATLDPLTNGIHGYWIRYNYASPIQPEISRKVTEAIRNDAKRDFMASNLPSEIHEKAKLAAEEANKKDAEQNARSKRN